MVRIGLMQDQKGFNMLRDYFLWVVVKLGKTNKIKKRKGNKRVSGEFDGFKFVITRINSCFCFVLVFLYLRCSVTVFLSLKLTLLRDVLFLLVCLQPRKVGRKKNIIHR